MVKRSSLAAAAVAPVMVIGLLAAAQAQTLSPAASAFLDATREYALLHRQIERSIGPLEINARPESLQTALQAMTDAMRAARSDARQGDFFKPAIAGEMRVTIDAALREHGMSPADVRAQEAFEGADPSTVVLRVNGKFPWLVAATMVPCVLGALPELPPELQYRFVGNDLVLIDIHAGLIVDILPRALAETTRLW